MVARTLQLATRWLIIAVLLLMCVAGSVSQKQASAAVTQTQTQTAFGTGVTTSVSFSPAATTGHLLIAVCANNGSSTITGPSGYTQAINESGTMSQGIFYKIAAGGETTTSCTYSSSNLGGMHIYEYSGLHTYSTLEAVNTTPSAASSSSANSGTVTTTHAEDFVFTAIINDAGATTSSWSNAFTDQTVSGNGFGQTGGKPTNRTYFDSSAFTTTSAGSYSTAASLSTTANWRGQIVAFRTLASSQSLTTDIVDGSGNSVASPSTALSSVSPGFICQTVTGNLGSSTQKIRVSNTTDNPGWSLALAATGGQSAVWSAPTTPVHSYQYNNSGSSGCAGGQLTVNASLGTLSAQVGCSTTGVSKGSSTAYVSGTVNAATLLSASNPAAIDCYWELINVSLSQKIPAGQLGGNYTLPMTLTLTAN